MSNMLRISEAASLALHAMVYLARNPDRLVSTHEIAEAHGVSENHLSKVRQQLVKAGLVEAHRGPGGGFRLARAPQTITLMDVFEAIEGGYKPADCLLARPACEGKSCVLGGLVERVNTEVRQYLVGTTLARLANRG